MSPAGVPRHKTARHKTILRALPLAGADVAYSGSHEDDSQRGDDKSEDLLPPSLDPAVHLRHDLTGLYRRRELAEEPPTK